MKICIFGSEIGPVKTKVFVGGAAVSAVRLAKGLFGFSERVLVFSSAPRGKSSRTYQFDWGVVINKRVPGRYMSFPYMCIFALVSFFGLFIICKRERIEVINSHSGNLALCVIPIIIGRFLGIPVVHTQYCALPLHRNRFVNYFILKLGSGFRTKFCAISRNVQKSFIRAGASKRMVQMIPPIVPSLKKEIECKGSYGMFPFDGQQFLLFVGNLKKNKGINVLFKAFYRIAEIFPDLKLVVTTELLHESFNKREEILQRWLFKHHLVNRVTWLRVVEDMPNLLRAAKVVVVPFLNLNDISDYPLVVLEALSVGTPVVVSDVGGVREIIRDGETGIIIPPDDPEELEKALELILRNHKLRQTMIEKIREISLLNYSFKSVTEKYRDVFSYVVK